MINLGISLWLACAAGLMATSCTDEADDGATLPDGKYPMTFTAAVDGSAATRATTDNTWTGGENVAIQIGSEVKKHTAANGGNLTIAAGDTPFYWQSATETKTVTAWYYGTGYNATPPDGTSWAVQSDQSATGADNTGDNYQRSDFLYAPATDITFGRRSSASLSFYHQTARVVVNIVNAEAATNVSAIQSVIIGNAGNVALSGSYTAPTGAGVTAGTWNTSSGTSTMGTITPKELAAPGTLTGGETALATYTALVIPQQMKGKKFIAVTLTNGNTYYYTPAQYNDANLQSGKQHTYDITVKHGYLEVTPVTVGSAWGGDGSAEDVTGKTLSEGYAPGNLKIGDYYYSDGNTSDGGYRKYANGSTTIMPVQPVLTDASGNLRTVIGIVLRVGYDGTNDDSQYKQKNGQTEMSAIHGYVLALYDANGGGTCKWGLDEETGTNTDKEGRFDGYKNTQIIKAYAKNKGKNLQNDFPATYHATDGYESQYPAPSNSSGWFLPSGGQCKCWLDNRYVLLASVEKATGNSGYSWNMWYWSSSESDYGQEYNVRYVHFNFSKVDDVHKQEVNYVRACLAF